MTGSVTTERWQKAQASERRYWDGLDVAELLRICAEKPAFLKLLDGARLAALFDGKSVLEIGCGPLGMSVASFYAGKDRVARLVKAEPLARVRLARTGAAGASWAAPFVAWVDALTDEGTFHQAAGEDLAFEGEFDTVVTYNVLDHVRDPLAILRNAHRALRPGGAILVGVDCLSSLGRLRFEHLTRRRAKGTILVDAHPYTFLPGHVTGMMSRAGFSGVAAFGLPGRLRRLAGSGYRPAFVGSKTVGESV